MSGAVDVLFDAIPTGIPHVERGSLRALAVTTEERSSMAPDIPTVAESGLPGYVSTTWFGIYAPAGIAPEHQARLHAAFVESVQDPDVVARLDALGIVAAEPHSPEEFADVVAADSARWKRIIEERGISLEQ